MIQFSGAGPTYRRKLFLPEPCKPAIKITEGLLLNIDFDGLATHQIDSAHP